MDQDTLEQFGQLNGNMMKLLAANGELCGDVKAIQTSISFIQKDQQNMADTIKEIPQKCIRGLENAAEIDKIKTAIATKEKIDEKIVEVVEKKDEKRQQRVVSRSGMIFGILGAVGVLFGILMGVLGALHVI